MKALHIVLFLISYATASMLSGTVGKASGKIGTPYYNAINSKIVGRYQKRRLSEWDRGPPGQRQYKEKMPGKPGQLYHVMTKDQRDRAAEQIIYDGEYKKKVADFDANEGRFMKQAWEDFSEVEKKEIEKLSAYLNSKNNKPQPVGRVKSVAERIKER